MSQKPERRQDSRCAVDFFVQEIREDRTYLHPAINLSSSGIYILVSDDRRAVDSQSTLALEFTLPTGVPVKATGQVAYVDDRHGQRGLGVQFAEITDDDRGAIGGFIDVMTKAQRRNHATA